MISDQPHLLAKVNLCKKLRTKQLRQEFLRSEAGLKAALTCLNITDFYMPSMKGEQLAAAIRMGTKDA